MVDDSKKMDEIVNSLANSLQVSSDPNNTAAPHPRFSQYKQKSSVPLQEARRKKFLDALKDKRYDYLKYVRSLEESGVANEDTIEDDDEGMDWSSQPRKPPRTYKNQLMLSEWLVEVPSDFSEEWLLVPCPVGKRCLVVSCHGKTQAFTKSGFPIYTFPSHLPGGKRKFENCSSSQYTMLDCVFNELERSFYVLDMMCWKGQPIFDSTTDFRFFWLHSKFSEIPEVHTQSKLNPYKFLPLPSYKCDSETLRSVLWSPMPFKPALDGLLFYSKLTHYTHGRTPLVGWLKAYMVPKLLNVEVPEHLCVNEPVLSTTSRGKMKSNKKKLSSGQHTDEKMML